MKTVFVLIGVAMSAAGCTKPVDTAWSGYVEGEYVYVAAPLAGALTTLSVQRGQQVTRGAALFTLDAQTERNAREQSAAALATARAQATDTSKGKRRDEIAVTRAQLAQARVQAALANIALSRDRKLVADAFLSAAAFDTSRANADAAHARVAELEASLRVAALPARTDAQIAAEATAQAAQAALAQSKWREEQKQQPASADAQVTDVFFRVGEWVPAGQAVVALLPPANLRARFFVPEREVGNIAVGQSVMVHCDGCGAPIAARIDRIAPNPEFTPPVIYSNEQRSRLVFMVEARPDLKDAPRLKPGQPLDVRRAAGR